MGSATMSSNSSKSISWACSLLLILLLLDLKNAECGSIIKTLPGFSGPLPFKLETGYVSVEESELFYYFVESQGRPRVDPLILYLVGGPGCSALNGFFYQTGPLAFNISDYTGGLPTLWLNPYAWTKTANIIFVDAPVGSGFSYATSWEGYYVSDTKSARQVHIFLRKWLRDHPEFVTNRFFIASDSYAGIITPIIAQDILDGNAESLQPCINLIGFLSGSPHTDSDLEDNSKIPFVHRMALLSDGLYNSAKKNCEGNYIDVDPSNAECLEDLKAISQCIEQINTQNILEPKCATISPKPNGEQVRRSVQENSRHFRFPWSRPRDYWCKNFAYLLSDIWANNETVRNALNVREGTIGEWYRCNLSLAEDTYNYDVSSALDYQLNLTETGLQVLLYSGDHDMVVTHLSTEEWIENLNITTDEYWRPWFVEGQVAGYTIKYTNYGYRLTFATLKGSGHSPTEYKHKECYEMFERWIHYYPL